MRAATRTLRGFTLVEVVIVVMILGVLGAIAVPRVIAASRQAADNGVRQTLAVIRSAIDTFAAEHDGAYPGADGQQETFKTNLAPYLRGKEFPICPVDAAKHNEVRMMAANDSVPPGDGETVGTHSWVYNYETGDFYINSREVSANGVTTYDQF